MTADSRGCAAQATTTATSAAGTNATSVAAASRGDSAARAVRPEVWPASTTCSIASTRCSVGAAIREQDHGGATDDREVVRQRDAAQVLALVLDLAPERDIVATVHLRPSRH